MTWPPDGIYSVADASEVEGAGRLAGGATKAEERAFAGQVHMEIDRSQSIGKRARDDEASSIE